MGLLIFEEIKRLVIFIAEGFSLNWYLLAFWFLSLVFFVHYSLSLEVILFWLFLILFKFLVFVFTARFGLLFLLWFDSNYPSDNPAFSLDLSGLIENLSQFDFLFLTHIHYNQFISVNIIRFHFRQALNNFSFDRELTTCSFNLKIYERTCDCL